MFLFFLGQALVGLPFAAFLIWRHRHDETWAAWTFLGLMLALYVALALRYLRVAPSAELFVAIAVAALLLQMRRGLLRIANPALRALAVAVTSSLLIVGFAAGGAAVMLASASADPAGETDATSRCELRDVARFLDREEGLGDRSRIILASMNHGPELLYRTKHAVLAGPYHRNEEGILDIYTILRASDEETSRALVESRGVELILLCPSPSEEWLFGSGASEESLYRRLLENRPPSWMRAHPLPASLSDSFRLYEVTG
jgi:hypothetical protein